MARPKKYRPVTRTNDAARSANDTLCGYRLMWVLVMFDLPVETPEERKVASGFRNDLLDLGFER